MAEKKFSLSRYAPSYVCHLLLLLIPYTFEYVVYYLYINKEYGIYFISFIKNIKGIKPLRLLRIESRKKERKKERKKDNQERIKKDKGINTLRLVMSMLTANNLFVYNAMSMYHSFFNVIVKHLMSQSNAFNVLFINK